MSLLFSNEDEVCMSLWLDGHFLTAPVVRLGGSGLGSDSTLYMWECLRCLFLFCIYGKRSALKFVYVSDIHQGLRF